ncbi:MAG: hypothetical protein AAFR61_30855 [Bacteroidota bacterium]
MQTQELLNEARELRRVMAKASQIAAKLQSQLPELEEPAMNAQCSVIRHFLHQTERQEEKLAAMLKAKIAS